MIFEAGLTATETLIRATALAEDGSRVMNARRIGVFLFHWRRRTTVFPTAPFGGLAKYVASRWLVHMTGKR